MEKKANYTEAVQIKIKVSGVLYTTAPDGSIVFEMTAVPLPKFDNCLLDRDVWEWSRQNNIPESVTSDAYEALEKSFYANIQMGCAFAAIKDCSTIEVN